MPLWVSFALLAVGILAIYVEIFVPAAGMIGLAGAGSIVAGVVLGYAYHDLLTGSIVLVASLVVTPVAVVIGLKAFPNTPVGRRLILGDTIPTFDNGGLGPPEGAGRQAVPVEVGEEGEAITVLRPSGTARFGSNRISVVTSGEYIDSGSPIRVTRVEGSRVVVRTIAARHGDASGSSDRMEG